MGRQAAAHHHPVEQTTGKSLSVPAEDVFEMPRRKRSHAEFQLDWRAHSAPAPTSRSARSSISSKDPKESQATTMHHGESNDEPRKRAKSFVKRSKSVDDEVSSRTKPDVSFCNMIRDAILESPEKKLLLAEIYDSIAEKYPYFRTAGEGWKNSVRHNLSIKRIFYREATEEELAKDPSAAPKKGSHWRVISDNDGYVIPESTKRRHSTGTHQIAGQQRILYPYIQPSPVQVPVMSEIGRRQSGCSKQPFMPGVPPIAISARTNARPLEAPFFTAIEPLPIEGGEVMAEMPWLATSPRMDRYIDWEGQNEIEENRMELEHHEQLLSKRSSSQF